MTMTTPPVDADDHNGGDHDGGVDSNYDHDTATDDDLGENRGMDRGPRILIKVLVVEAFAAVIVDVTFVVVIVVRVAVVVVVGSTRDTTV